MFNLVTENLNRSERFDLWRFVLAIFFAALFLSGSSTQPPGPAPAGPLPYISYRTDYTAQHRNLLVLLRGYSEDNTIFAKAGIIEEIRRRRIPFDIIAPDAHFGYYQSQTIETRLKEDIIDPARRQGYKHIWLAGVSMGGLGCILYLRKYPNDVDGVLLTSPFLGWPPVLQEISNAGGVEAWRQTTGDPHDWERMLWSWIKYHDFAGGPPVWMGYGDHDELISAGPPLLASVLPSQRVFTVPGQHDVATFKTIALHELDILARQGYR